MRGESVERREKSGDESEKGEREVCGFFSLLSLEVAKKNKNPTLRMRGRIIIVVVVVVDSAAVGPLWGSKIPPEPRSWPETSGEQ